MKEMCREGYVAEWPTKALKATLEGFGKGTESIGVKLDKGKVKDITNSIEARLQILGFMPKIRLLGPELWFERWRKHKNGTWGGVLARALEEKGTGTRCLQYIYVYTRQLTIVSPLWWVVCPLLIAWVPGSLAAFFPLFVYSIFLHVLDSTARLRVRVTTGLIIFWIIWAGEAFISPYPFWVLNILSVSCFLYFLYSIRTETEFSHKMDYIPVFIWIVKRDQEWTLESVAWDIWHYRAKKQTKEELTSGPWARLQPGGFIANEKRIRLAIDNPWHSLFRRPHQIWFLLVMFLGIVIAALILLSEIQLLPASWYEIHPQQPARDVIFLILVSGTGYLSRYRWNIVRDEGKVAQRAEEILKGFPQGLGVDEAELDCLWKKAEFMPLCDSNLDFLWNLGPKVDAIIRRQRFSILVARASDRVHRIPEELKQARFIVISKLQDPFRPYSWESFLDSKDST